MDEVFDRGQRIRRTVLGDEHVDRAAASTTDFDRDFQDFITRYAWGEVWGRGGLDVRERHLVTLAVLSALGREHELALHLAATRRTGIRAEEVAEVLQHVGIYAGIPAAHSAFRIAKSILAEEEMLPDGESEG